MKLSINIETDKRWDNFILDDILGFAKFHDAKALEIEGLDECDPFFTEEEIAKIINEVENNRINPIKINLKPLKDENK